MWMDYKINTLLRCNHVFMKKMAHFTSINVKAVSVSFVPLCLSQASRYIELGRFEEEEEEERGGLILVDVDVDEDEDEDGMNTLQAMPCFSNYGGIKKCDVTRNISAGSLVDDRFLAVMMKKLREMNE